MNTGAKIGKEEREEHDEGKGGIDLIDEDGSGSGATEKRRVGIAMATRAGDIWELAEGRE